MPPIHGRQHLGNGVDAKIKFQKWWRKQHWYHCWTRRRPPSSPNLPRILVLLVHPVVTWQRQQLIGLSLKGLSVLTNLLSSSIPNQLLPYFKIAPLPSVIDSWLCYMLAKMLVNKARRVRPKMRTLAAGADGYNYLTASSSRMTHTFSPYPNHDNVQSFYQPSPKPSVKPASLHQLSLPCLKEQSDPPLTTYLRAFLRGQQPDPCLDDDEKLSILPSQQYRGKRNLNKNVRLPEAERSWAERRLILGIKFPQETMSSFSLELYHLL